MKRAPARHRAIAAAAVVAAAVLAASCSPESRYRVLSAVFDGVPPPAGFETPAPGIVVPSVEVPGSGFLDDLRTLREQRPPRDTTPVILSVHKPVAERKCRECHGDPEDVAIIPHDARLCDKCHLDQRRDQGWDHGPINLGTCIPCHTPHRSRHKSLLSEPLPDLCLHCHKDVSPDGPDYHVVANFADCSACHDPHRMY